jgi:hypothetical protein
VTKTSAKPPALLGFLRKTAEVGLGLYKDYGKFDLLRVQPRVDFLRTDRLAVRILRQDRRAAEGLSGKQGVDGVGSGPILRALDQPFFDSMAEGVLEAVDLGLGFVAGDDALVSASPELFLPLVGAPGFASQVGADIAHEVGQVAEHPQRREEDEVVR